MTYEPTKHHRRSIRLQGYDYRQAGAYFVTICSQDRHCLFGDVSAGQMHLSDAGEMVKNVWRELPRHYAGVDVDASVVMPNHVHGVMILVGAGLCACPGQPQGVVPTTVGDAGQPRGVAPTMSLPDVVQRFKSLTTAKYRQGVLRNGWQPFPHRLWQRNYYEHIIRDDEELNRIRQYIIDNPARWGDDPENPQNVGAGLPTRPDETPSVPLEEGDHGGSPLRDQT